MKNKNTYGYLFRKGLLFFAAAVLLLFGLSARTYAASGTTGWKNGYYYINGKKQKSTWIKDGKHRYYLDSKGKKIIGWKKIGDSYYFFNQKGNNYASGKPEGAQITKLSKAVVTMGIDVSTWQGSIQWNKVKAAGVDFVMIRIGYGKGRYGSRSCTLDNRFQTYVEGAQEAGIPIGIYFYSYATSEEQALKEAEFTIKQLDGIPVSFPVAYDIEDDYIIKNTSKAERTAMAKTYMDTIAAAGYYPMFYCNQTWYNTYLKASELEGYDFWYARYTNEEPDITEYPYAIWQATSMQKLSGITENTVDIDFLYKDYSDIIETRDSALKYGWYKEGDAWQYYYRGKRKTDGWFTIGGYTYYMESSGAHTGWKTISDNKYYFNSKGEMQTGFVKIGLKRYLFDENGILQYTTDKPGVTIDEDGVCHIKKGWYKDSAGKYFYRNSDGSIAKNKWIKTKGKKYYVGSNGRRATGFKTIKKKRYYFKSNGEMKTGWLTYQGHKYYFKKNGEMAAGQTITIKGKKYTFNTNGQLK
ncbi:MAG: GH25 family lysozyme [Lachnospiraceae bacterium]